MPSPSYVASSEAVTSEAAQPAFFRRAKDGGPPAFFRGGEESGAASLNPGSEECTPAKGARRVAWVLASGGPRLAGVATTGASAGEAKPPLRLAWGVPGSVHAAVD